MTRSDLKFTDEFRLLLLYSFHMMENVYFGAAKLTLDKITFACRDLLPLITVAQSIVTSAHHMQRHLSVLFGVASFAETRHET
jgi:hypothetical protein